jgi:hypothetical protein
VHVAHGGKEMSRTNFGRKNSTKGDHQEDPDIHLGVFKRIPEKQEEKVWNGLIWFKIGSSKGGFFQTWY